MVSGEEKEMKRFVTFEGIDGSGKSTVSKKVFEKLKDDGYDVVLTFEPTDTWIGRCVSDFIKNEKDPYSTAFAFISDRIEHCKKIKNWIDAGKIVLCDRYADSTYAYQAAQIDDIKDPMKWLMEMSKDRILIPDITFLFVIDPKESLKRIQDRDELIPFERLDFLKKVHKNYIVLSDQDHFINLDATKDIDFLMECCVNKILE